MDCPTKTIIPFRHTIDPFIFSGNLQHPNKTPFNNQELRLVTYGSILRKKISMGRATTDAHGRYSFTFSITKWTNQETTDAILQIYEETLPSEGRKKRIVNNIPVKIDLRGTSHDIGTIIGKMYEPESDKPILADSENGGDFPQQFSISFILNIAKGAVKAKLDSVFLSSVSSLISTETVQNAYMGNYSHLELTEELVIDMILNWAGTKYFQPTPVEDTYIFALNWDDVERDEDVGVAYCNCTALLKKVDGKFRFAENQVEFVKGVVHTYTPKDPDFLDSLYLTASGCLFLVEAHDHLGTAHLVTEELALAAAAPINLNPIKEITNWIFDGIFQIDHFGKKVIFDKEEGVLGLAPFSSKGLNGCLTRPLTYFCYRNFCPDGPISDDDLYGTFKIMCWDRIVVPFVEGFITEKGKEIEEYWNEIESLSENLVSNSLNFKSFRRNPNSTEIDNHKTGRIKLDGKRKAVRPILSLIDLKQYLRTSIFLSVFSHSYVHLLQDKFARNLKLASLAPRGQQENLRQTLGGTSVPDAIRQLEIAEILIEATMPRLVDNPYGNIPPLFLKLVNQHAEEILAKTGFDIRKCYSSVTI